MAQNNTSNTGNASHHPASSGHLNSSWVGFDIKAAVDKSRKEVSLFGVGVPLSLFSRWLTQCHCCVAMIQSVSFLL